MVRRFVSAFLAAGIAVCIPAATAFAADATPASSSALSSCFDYYAFNSTPVVISSSLNKVAQSSTIAFTGTVQNTNTYPIVDASVYVKVFKQRGSGAKDINGPDVVDWFPVDQNITLKAGETLPLSFTWKVPGDAEPGNYQVAAFVSASDRFNMSGLSFTDDVIGGSYNFSVVGNGAGAVRFDKTSATVNGTPFYFAAYPPTVQSGSVTVSAKIANTTSLPYKGTVTWRLYYWDALQTSHLLSETQTPLKIHPNDSATVSYTAADSAHSVYYLVAEIDSPSGAKSIAGMRFVRGTVNEPRINFVGVNQYPPSSGVAFVCVHSTGTAPASDGMVELTVRRTGILGMLGNLASVSYSGDIPGAISALAVPLHSSAASFSVTAKLYQKGILVDEITVPYGCDALGAPCDTYVYYGAVGLGLIVLAGLFFVFRKKKQLPPSSYQPPKTSV